MDYRIWFLSGLVLFLFGGTCMGQRGESLDYIHLTVEDGLPSNRIYRMMEDSKGFLWLASDAGVARYNGTYFDHFTTRDGLGDNDILSLVEDEDGRIWFLSFNGKLSYLQDGIFYNTTNSELLSGIENNSPILDYYIDSRKRIWFITSHNGPILIDGNTAKQFSEKERKGLSIRGRIQENEKGEIFIFSPELDTIVEILPGIFAIPKWNMEYSKGKITTRAGVVGDSCVTKYDSLLNLSSLKKHIKFIAKTQNYDANRLEWNGIDTIWVHYFQKGSELFQKKGDKWISSGIFLPNENNSDHLKHHVFGDVFSTLGNGIFIKNRNKPLFVKKTEPSHATDLEILFPVSDSAFLDICGQTITRYKISPQGFSPQNSLESMGSYNLSRLIGDSLFLWKGQNMSVLSKTGEMTLVPVKFPLKQVLKDILKLKDGKYLLALSQGIYEMDSIGSLQRSPLPVPETAFRPLKLYQNDDGNLFIGTNTGLVICNSGTCNIEPTISGQVTSFTKWGKWLVIGVQGSGLLFYEGIEKKYHLTRAEGLASDFEKWVKASNEYLVSISRDGITIIKDIEGLPEITAFAPLNQMIESEILDGIILGDILVIRTNSRLYAFNLGEISNSENPPPSIALVEANINGNAVNTTFPKNLKFFENNLSLKFRGLPGENFQPLSLEYSRDGQEGWRVLENDQLELLDLSSGKHDFFFRYKVPGTKVTSQPRHLELYISPPWYKSATATILFILLSLLILYLTFRIVLRNRARQESLHRKIAQSRLTALRSQMNPHFIFNSMNSIQAFITQNEEQEALSFLSKFGNLVRRILDNSEKDFIHLEDEISTLTLYLELEKLRTKDFFTFEFTIGEGVEPDFHKIPPTLIQPILENSIWHGILHRESPGHIEVNFELTDSQIICTVTDNGVGRERSRELQKGKQHKSMALGITRERLNLLNERKGTSITLSVEDVVSPEGDVAGTRVILTLPEVA